MKTLLTYALVGRGGDALQVQAIAKAFSDLGHEVTVVGATKLAPYAFGTATGRLRSMARCLPWWGKDLLECVAQIRLWVAMRRIQRHEAFDLVFHRGSIYDFVGGRIPGSCPIIAHLDAPFAVEREYRGDGYFRQLHQRSMCSLGQKASLILTPSLAARDYYVDMGVPSAKIRVVPNGVSRDGLESARKLANAQSAFADPLPRILGFVGSLSRWHRVDLLLRVLSLLDAADPGAYRARIVGQGERYDDLRALAVELEVDDIVEWLGALPHEQAVKEIASFDIGVLPSTLPTGAPMKLFEYAAFARPIIAPDLPNIRAHFDDKEVLYFQPEDALAIAEGIRYLVENPREAQQLGENAQRKAEQYTWESIVQRVIDEALKRDEAGPDDYSAGGHAL